MSHEIDAIERGLARLKLGRLVVAYPDRLLRCLGCGVAFAPADNRQKHCSKRCAERVRRAKARDGA